ncbi:hypothetical protein [Methanolobus zinderi]|nr:hypothetical protein [Methanolobus zinderi]
MRKWQSLSVIVQTTSIRYIRIVRHKPVTRETGRDSGNPRG